MEVFVVVEVMWIYHEFRKVFKTEREAKAYIDNTFKYTLTGIDDNGMPIRIEQKPDFKIIKQTI